MYKLSKAQLRRGKKHLVFANRISEWLVRAGVRSSRSRTTLAIGIADSLAASAIIRRNLKAMLATNPRTAAGARRAARHAVNAGVWMFGELLDHIQEMKLVWERDLESRLYARVPDDDDRE
jgi:hypothetical protein